ncbi:Gfo/Idh/MocA family protein [Paenibacillus nasutitermitis]|uniref:Gfo/Idh/MocA-like oxidoreductase N-terminal domain-containing protein n=1 Tax=Paenibacillus nasutitermitis TaxID=1652958 RepID=A0A916YPD7_9BACL|nr:Gfo/Idh/MocA family oxidoreductase [Paenibacillus nasutitermitis]GGD53627.1 hypothetical protein GCM10010911_08980 [Paenibacillus nasutitermitis]
MNLHAFGIIGGGWRAEFFLRIAEELPERFWVAGMVVRSEEKGKEIERRWAVPTYRTIGDMLGGTRPSFVVVSVPRSAAPGILLELAAAGVPALCETPPAESLEELVSLYQKLGGKARIQIAEQYPYQPNHAARLELVRSGKLGPISLAEVSAAHDYHGLVLLRRFLGIGFENAVIRGQSFTSKIVQGRGREGGPDDHRLVDSEQILATFQFDGKLGVYDFTGDQYFSWIRSPRLLIRGERGEINNFDVRYLQDHRTPVHTELKRLHAGHDGNLEGHHLKAILCGDAYLYRNEFAPGRLSDDEIAVAACLARMGEYSEGGPEFYSLAEACQDHYLGLMMRKAVESKEAVHTQTQCWS